MAVPSYFQANAIYCGDCRHILKRFPDEQIDLIYADPPFFSNRNYEVIWGDGYELRSFEDRWKGGIENYVDWIRPALEQCNRVLKKTGAFYLHCDWHAVHYLKVALDGIFGRDNFRNEISVKRIRKNVNEFATVKRLNTAFDSILFYAKSDEHRIVPPVKPEIKPDRWHAFDASELRTGMDYELFGHKPPLGGHWRWTKERAEKAIKEGRLRPNPKTGKPEYLISGTEHTLVTSAWDDISAYSFKSGYPTEKSEALLKRIIEMSSKPTDIVLDPFCGCGTAVVVASDPTLSRRYIGVDISPTACNLIERRLRSKKIYPSIIGMPLSLDDLKKLPPFEFQNWIVKRLLGRVSRRKSGDMGIDGYTFEGHPIQVKQSESVGRNVIDNFETAIKRANAKIGLVVAFSFVKNAYEEAARAKNHGDVDIKLVTVEDLLKEDSK